MTCCFPVPYMQSSWKETWSNQVPVHNFWPPKVIFTFSHILLPPFASSCWNNGIFRVEKNMLPTSKQGSNGKEDFMCIKPQVYVHTSAFQPQLCHSSRQCQQCLFSTVRHPQSPQGQGRCSPAQEQPCRDHFPFQGQIHPMSTSLQMLVCAHSCDRNI